MNEQIRRARQGDPEAFVWLMEANRQSLYKIARSVCREPMDAEDAVAQTVLDGWEKLPELKNPAGFRSWLVRILINNCNDILRRRARVTLMEEVPEQPWEDRDPGGLYFEELMGRLSGKVRPVMQLYYGEGFRVREIARILNIPPGTVTTRLMRGRQQLADAVKEGSVIP